MPVEIEVNMKVPTLTVRPPNEPERRIDNSQVRFRTRVTVPALPKPGESLLLKAGEESFDCTVTRADWHDEHGLFLVSCSFSKRSISPHLYETLVNDSTWTMKPLLE